MSPEDRHDELEPQAADYVVAFLKGLAANVPFVGSLFAELIGIRIPRQRMDRVAQLALLLRDRVAKLEQDHVRDQFADPEFIDLLEEGVDQAFRAVSSERLAQIAEAIAASLSTRDITYAESQHMLRLLGELNDVEIIRLGSYQQPALSPGGSEYHEKHKDVLALALASYTSSQKDKDKATLQQSYDQHLERLGLLSVRYAVDNRTKLPQFDNHTGAQKVRGYQITSLGSMLCRQIGLAKEE